MVKKKGVGGFLGSIFRGKAKEDTPKPASKPKNGFGNKKKVVTEDAQDDRRPVPKKEQRVKSQPRSKQKKRPVQQEQPTSRRPVSEERKPRPKVTSKQREPEHDVERKYYSKDESQEIYGQRSMEQNIFLYSSPSKFLAIQQYINDSFEGITVVGTSNLSRVNEEYETKLNCGHLLVFIDSEEELQGLLQFIQTGINIKSTNPEILHIYLVVTNKEVNRAKILNLKNSHLTNIFKLDTGLDKLSTGIVDQIMSKIIEKQPAYIKETPLVVPKVAAKKNTLDKEVFKLKDLDTLKAEMGRIREAQGNTTPYDVLADKVTYAKGEEDINDIKNMIPELAVLEEYRESLEEYLETSDGNIDPKDLNEIIISKLELTLLQEQTLQGIFGSIIGTAKKNVETEDEKVRRTNESTLENFIPLAQDKELKDMLGERAKLKDSVSQGFIQYKKEVQLVSNAIETRRYLYQDMQKSVQSVIGMDNEDIDPEILNTAIAVQQNLEQSKMELMEDKAQVEQRLVRTLNFTNSLLRDYNVIVTLDEIIIDKLIEDNQRLSVSSVTQVFNVDNPLKAKAKTMIVLDDEDFMKITPVLFTIDTLVVTDQVFKVSKRLTEMSVEQFIEDYTNKNVNVVTVGETDLSGVKEEMLKKLKYLAPSFNKIIFLFGKESNEEWVGEAFENSTEVIYLTSSNKEELLKLNELKLRSDNEGLYGTTVIINNWDRENAGNGQIPTLAEMRVLGDFRGGVRELYISTEQAIRDKDKMRELILMLRNV